MFKAEIQSIIDSMTPETRDYIRNLPEDNLSVLHRSFGMGLRNGFRHNKYPWLFTHCHDLVDPRRMSFDALSTVAIKLIWEHLREIPPDQSGTSPE